MGGVLTRVFRPWWPGYRSLHGPAIEEGGVGGDGGLCTVGVILHLNPGGIKGTAWHWPLSHLLLRVHHAHILLENKSL